ncbi:glucose-6-phosphate isomerase [Tibeticola sediminis]|uniref:Glucose-6-phosphate isomerase n=1 Tax=Tibeticola sediminis TaxID=1917811 RepID=A0A3N4UWK3_9BURK|nr:glucose-6-phosphate isomerase [Tibeticola sediminis]RPE73195.1 glucose-6-phosphate isomerase [Tibeticola sediminis]
MDWRERPRCDETPEWAALTRLAAAQPDFDVRAAFARDPERFARLSQGAPELFADWSRSRIDAAAEAQLLALARACGLEAHRDALFAGEPVNTTEGRAALHPLLRAPAVGSAIAGWPTPALAPLHRAVLETLERMLAYAEAVRADPDMTDVVNIGIGGSDLGPRMAVQALAAWGAAGPRVHFVSNLDGHELAQTLAGLAPERTLFLVVSKTFTTLETLTNAHSARDWFLAQGGRDVARHFVGITTAVEAARAFGIETTFGFWDWVGGRYSVWSAVGLALAIAIGAEGFRAFLAGAHAMDAHFCTAPLEANLPARLGLLDLWNRDVLGFGSRCVAPYHAGLARLPAYLQQLEMESNGKRVDLRGRALTLPTSPVVWGEPGTNGQHAFFQLLHQGTDVIPVEFLAVARARHGLVGHHAGLVANALAQARALMVGQDDPGGHRHFPGNRPSSFLLLEDLTPRSLGALLALYEHRVFVSGSLWGIDSFDQWGVELGKALARDLTPRLLSGDVTGLDAATAGLIGRLAPFFEKK